MKIVIIERHIKDLSVSSTFTVEGDSSLYLKVEDKGSNKGDYLYSAVNLHTGELIAVLSDTVINEVSSQLRIMK